jgi:hypothetical protein
VLDGGGARYRATVDDRLRPVRLEGPDDLVITLQWSSEGPSVAYAIDDGWTTETGVLAFDPSDAALLGHLAAWEQTTGLDLGNSRRWIEQHPGQFAAIHRGEVPPPSVMGSPVSGQRLKDGRSELENGADPAVDRTLQGAGILGGYLAALGSSLTSAGVLGVRAVLSPLGWGLILTAGTSWLLRNALLALFGQTCDPCSVWCFVGCLFPW